MSATYSNTRPLHASGPETPLYQELENYAHKKELQDLLQKMITDVLIAKPEDPLIFFIEWMDKEKKQRLEMDF